MHPKSSMDANAVLKDRLSLLRSFRHNAETSQAEQHKDARDNKDCFFTFATESTERLFPVRRPVTVARPPANLSSMTLQDIERLGHDEHIVRTIFNALQAA